MLSFQAAVPSHSRLFASGQAGPAGVARLRGSPPFQVKSPWARGAPGVTPAGQAKGQERSQSSGTQSASVQAAARPCVRGSERVRSHRALRRWGLASSAATPRSTALLRSAREGPPFPREPVIDISAPSPRLRSEPELCVLEAVLRGRELCDAASGQRRPSFPPGLGRQRGGRDGQGGARALGAGRGAERSAGWRPRVEKPGGGCSRPAPRPRRASRDRSSRRGGARLRGIMSVCQAGPG